MPESDRSSEEENEASSTPEINSEEIVQKQSSGDDYTSSR